ncbi:MAG: hypothetical protein AB7M12_01210 [Hyphomonadaceae bacterium]
MAEGAALFRAGSVTFDPGDGENGSLYVCDPAGAGEAAVAAAIAALRARALWSDAPPKQVRADQVEAYATQLSFIAQAQIAIDGAALTIARFDHPKFPSSAVRFAAWKRAFEER